MIYLYPRKSSRIGRLRIQNHHGQSSVEYVVVCAALALVLRVGMSNHDSVLWQLLDAFRTAYEKFSYAISLPT